MNDLSRNEFLKQMTEASEKALSLMAKKNSDYAEEQDPFKNFRFANLVNVSVPKAILVRITDKIGRINRVIDKNGEVEIKDEEVADTILDAVNYFLILYVALKNNE